MPEGRAVEARTGARKNRNALTASVAFGANLGIAVTRVESRGPLREIRFVFHVSLEISQLETRTRLWSPQTDGQSQKLISAFPSTTYAVSVRRQRCVASRET